MNNQLIHPYIYAGLPSCITKKKTREDFIIEYYFTIKHYQLEAIGINNVEALKTIIKSPNRTRIIVDIRKILMYSYKLKGLTTTSIGRMFNRDHSTVIHAMNTVKDLLSYPEHKDVKKGIENLLKMN